MSSNKLRINPKAMPLKWEPVNEHKHQVWVAMYEDKQLMVCREHGTGIKFVEPNGWTPTNFAGFIALKKVGAWSTPMRAMENVGRIVRGLEPTIIYEVKECSV